MTFVNDKKSWSEIIEHLENSRAIDPKQSDLIKRKIIAGEEIDLPLKKFLLKKYNDITHPHEKSASDMKESKMKKIFSPLGQINILKKFKNSGQRATPPKNSSFPTDLKSRVNSKKTEQLTKPVSLESRKNKSKSQSTQSILLDEYEKHPTANFESLGKTISNIITESPPNFTLGIYGEWGIGKTTLMKSIDRNLKEKCITENECPVLTIWFNAWRFERDQNPITHSLMKSIAFDMDTHKFFKPVAEQIFNAIKIFDEDSYLVQFPPDIQNNDRSHDLIKNSSMHEKIQRESIYFNGISKIKNTLAKIRQENGSDFRIVVFIDDLDRCSPDKTIELLESIKMLQEVEGLIFIVALSYHNVTRLITNVYNNIGVKGEDYLKKIIQLPITIPPWSRENFSELISQKIAPKLNEEYSKFVLQNPGILSQVANLNPRQLKRFINNVIIAFETFAKNENVKITLDEIFLAKILKTEWPEFYNEIIKNEEFRTIIYWMINRPKEMKKYFNYLESPEQEDITEQKQKRYYILVKTLGSNVGILRNSQIKTLVNFDNTTWTFFENVKKVMFGISDWNLIDSVAGIIEDIPYDIHLTQKEQSVPKFQDG